ISYVVDEKYRLPQLNSVYIPEGIDDKVVRGRLLDEYSLEIGAGLGDFAGKVWRFGLMGTSSRVENVVTCLNALEKVLSEMGLNLKRGAAESAAHQSYANNPMP
ncbi:MAG: alanine--glyoxylate aminotransferase family protein, partial [Nitrosomonas sp.]|nr:alanine--glyoxylate aminotransferase family protein [Nitrosomonas sp.]